MTSSVAPGENTHDQKPYNPWVQHGFREQIPKGTRHKMMVKPAC